MSHLQQGTVFSLINCVCLRKYGCGKAAHIWWITRVSSLRFSYSGCARTLRFNRSNKWSIWFKSRLFAGHQCLHVVCYKYYTCVSIRVTWYVITCQHHTEIGTDRKKRKNRQNDVISIPHQSYVSWMVTLGVFVCMKTLERVLLCLFSPYLMFFHNRQSTFLPNSTTTYFPCTRSPNT